MSVASVASVKASIKQARTCLKAADYPATLEAFAEAEAQFLALEDPPEGLSGLYLEWAHALLKAGQPEQTLARISQYLQHLKALTPEIQVRIQYLLAQGHLAFARQLLAMPDLPLAARHFHKALGYHGLSDFERADAHYQQGVVLLEIGDYEKSLRSLDNALELFAKLEEHFWSGMTRLKKGMVYLKQEQVNDAMEETQAVIQALEGASRKGETAVLMTAYELMSELCRYQNDFEGAQFWREKLL